MKTRTSADTAMHWASAVSNKAPDKQPSILLVDDDDYTLDLERKVLLSMGYSNITTAHSAQEALLQLEHDRLSADVIICDLNMPGIDGIEFLKTLDSSAYRGSAILLSGEAPRLMHSVQRLLGGHQLTILGALTKPARRKELCALIDSWQPLADKPEEAAFRFAPFTEGELRAAIARAQLTLHYQPQVDIQSGAFIGLEALVRWNHPVHGLLGPHHFISVAESCGLINDLTHWVIDNALLQRQRWAAEGAQQPIAINVSMDCLKETCFWQRLTDNVKSMGASPSDLTVEVTESRVMAFSPVALENLIRLRMKGFMLSIDDFGTGHSSLAQLRDVPFGELKIDRDFVSGARQNQVVRPILEGSLALANQLSMTAVAEGVETQDDWELLRELKCRVAQGYFIGRPFPGDGLWDWLSAWQGRVCELTSDMETDPA